ncbi:MAG: hypothetical protein ACI8QQ_001417 [Psychroserpens sp.]|jgi:hypothetical protein
MDNRYNIIIKIILLGINHRIYYHKKTKNQLIFCSYLLKKQIHLSKNEGENSHEITTTTTSKKIILPKSLQSLQDIPT